MTVLLSSACLNRTPQWLFEYSTPESLHRTLLVSQELVTLKCQRQEDYSLAILVLPVVLVALQTGAEVCTLVMWYDYPKPA